MFAVIQESIKRLHSILISSLRVAHGILVSENRRSLPPIYADILFWLHVQFDQDPKTTSKGEYAVDMLPIHRPAECLLIRSHFHCCFSGKSVSRWVWHPARAQRFPPSYRSCGPRQLRYFNLARAILGCKIRVRQARIEDAAAVADVCARVSTAKIKVFASFIGIHITAAGHLRVPESYNVQYRHLTSHLTYSKKRMSKPHGLALSSSKQPRPILRDRSSEPLRISRR